MSKTKIVIIQRKEIIYTALFVVLAIALIFLLVFMFLPKKNNKSVADGSPKYIPGVYTNQITLNNTALNVEVTLDENHVNGVKIANLNESITTMLPCVAPALDDIKEQLNNNVEIDNMEINEDYQYTQMLLLGAIEGALEKATP